MVGVSARSSRLKLSDLAALVRLAGEAGEVSRVPAERRAHVLARLVELCGADKGVYAQFDTHPAGWTIRPGTSLFHLTPASELRKVSFFYKENRPRDPVMDLMAASAEPILVTTPYQYFSRDAWRRSEHYNEVRAPADIREQLYGQYRANGVTHGIGLHRRRDEPFGRREIEIVSIFLNNAGQTLLEPASPHAASIDKLANRLRPVLQRFLAGDSEKEAARSLGLTHNTVHTYAKQIYRHFEVSSRAELLARFIA